MVPKARIVNDANCLLDKSSELNLTQENLIKKNVNITYESTSFATACGLNSAFNADNNCQSDIHIQIPPEKKKIIYDKNDIENSSNDNNCEDDYVLLLSSTQVKKGKTIQHIKNAEIKEKSKNIFLQTIFPFVMAGLGVVAAGILLDKVQHWDVFISVPEIFILVPALLGMKGNLEMTLASRLSTYANRGDLDDSSKRWSIVWGNMMVVEAQAMVIAFLASLFAMVLGWIPDGKWENEHAIMLCTGSLLTGAIASGLLGFFMILVVLISKRIGINPDNVATPIAAALGDLVTLLLLSSIVKGLYSVLHQPSTSWIGLMIIFLFIVLTPLFLFLSYRNFYTKDVIKNGWMPVVVGMGISSLAGLTLDFAVSINPGVAVFVPIINGVGGNLVAVQASRISTFLHASRYPLGELPKSEKLGCLSPCRTFSSSNNPHAVGARVMLFMVVPGQIAFVLIIQAVQAGHTTITLQFVAVYLLMSLIQVVILLQICNWMVILLWKRKQDPDNSAIPYLTGIGDFLGTALLVLGFAFLWLVGDRDMDVGD